MTRTEHLEWCKKRALEYLDRGDVTNAIASMMSDMEKHPETAIKNPVLNMLGMQAAMQHDSAAAHRFIVGFN